MHTIKFDRDIIDIDMDIGEENVEVVGDPRLAMDPKTVMACEARDIIKCLLATQTAATVVELYSKFDGPSSTDRYSRNCVLAVFFG